MPTNSKGIEVAEILSDACIGCQICISECPVGAIELSSAGVAEIDPEVCVGCGKCADVCPVEAVAFETSKRRTLAKDEAPAKLAEASGPVAVFIETDTQGRAVDVSWELLGKAAELAEKRESRVVGFLLGDDITSVADEAASYGCQEVHAIEHPRLDRYTSLLFGRALSQLSEAVQPEILLVGATAQGRDLAGVVATMLETGLTADCTGLDIEEETGLLLMTRPTFGGNIMATIFCEKHRPQMSTVRPKVMPIPEARSGQPCDLVKHDWTPPEASVPELVDWIDESSRQGVDITQYPTLVVAGKGACEESAFRLLEELAELLGGAVACSRPVVESGLMPYERQVGQTGKTVAPKLYIGVGVSGAIQHRVAIQGAQSILAINSDASAPIFQLADAGIVGDYSEVVPELVAQLKQRKGHHD